MSREDERPELPRTVVAIALAFVAGCVDAIGWLSLGNVFTAQMSGNVVLLAVHIAAGDEGRAAIQAESIAAFFAGLVLTGSVIEIGMRQRVRRIFVAALAIELLMVALFAIAASLLAPSPSGPPLFALIAVLAFAMGAQNTSLRMAGILSIFTTHITGTFTSLSEEIIICCFSLLRPKERAKPDGGFAAENLRSRHRKAYRNAVRSIVLLAGFFFGALAGAWLEPAVGAGGATAVPLILLLGVAVFDWIAPLTVFPSSAEKE